jgi:hypothetical protein
MVIGANSSYRLQWPLKRHCGDVDGRVEVAASALCLRPSGAPLAISAALGSARRKDVIGRRRTLVTATEQVSAVAVGAVALRIRRALRSGGPVAGLQQDR